jgi:DNA-binding MarR family transcriptional regulator
MLPLTVTSRSLLVNDSDSLFRELIQDLLTLAYQSQELRGVLARQFGVSEPTYRVFMAICQLAGERGVSVGAVAKYLRVSGTFITREAGKLVRLGHVQKGEDPGDRRGVLLSITEQGRRSFAAFTPTSQMINDEMFGALSVQQFRSLCEIVRLLVERAQRTILLSRMTLGAGAPAGKRKSGQQSVPVDTGRSRKAPAVRKV